ncbi:MAG: hypothetical protein LBS55_01355 [Prevotellaceae bacterium]|jgi:hypothetical protein|nr:hypothetical protein [Prevotellaceae bacterium]
MKKSIENRGITATGALITAIATKFNDEARAKLILRWEQLETERSKLLTPEEMFLRNAQIMVEHSRRIADIENKVQALEAKTATHPDYFTIVGYGTLHHVSLNLKQASLLGRRASELCKKRDIKTDTTPDPRFGVVKLYPATVLEEVFEQSLI